MRVGARSLRDEMLMPLRTFLTRDGSTWWVWHVESTTVSTIPGAPREWLAFQDAEGVERRRLLEIPPNWEDLSDERLDLLRLNASPAKTWERLPTPPHAERYGAPDADAEG